MDAIVSRRRLSHIDIGGAAYFLTFRLAAGQRSPLSEVERTFVQEHIQRMGPGSLSAFVVMPDHVHLLYLSAPGEKLSRTLQALKSASAHRLARLSRREAPIWQHETFDRVIRGEREFEQTWRYIESNPVRAGLAPDAEGYRWSSAWGRAGGEADARP
jgi:REP element-mobilizing transposase RayT